MNRIPRTWTAFGVTLVAVVFLAGSVQAQGLQNRTRLAVRTGYDVEREAWGLGGVVRVPIANSIELMPSVDYFFIDPGSHWQGNIDVAFRLGAKEMFYVGGGLAVINRKVNNAWRSDGGLNLFAGIAVEPNGGRFGLFLEPRYTVRDGTDPIYISFGGTIALGP